MQSSYNDKDFEYVPLEVHENLHTCTLTSAQGKHLEERDATNLLWWGK
jgi:predicted metalloprotease with PDZ domain